MNYKKALSPEFIDEVLACELEEMFLQTLEPSSDHEEDIRIDREVNDALKVVMKYCVDFDRYEAFMKEYGQ